MIVITCDICGGSCKFNNGLKEDYSEWVKSINFFLNDEIEGAIDVCTDCLKAMLVYSGNDAIRQHIRRAFVEANETKCEIKLEKAERLVKNKTIS